MHVSCGVTHFALAALLLRMLLRASKRGRNRDRVDLNELHQATPEAFELYHINFGELHRFTKKAYELSALCSSQERLTSRTSGSPHHGHFILELSRRSGSTFILEVGSAGCLTLEKRHGTRAWLSISGGEWTEVDL